MNMQACSAEVDAQSGLTIVDHMPRSRWARLRREWRTARAPAPSSECMTALHLASPMAGARTWRRYKWKVDARQAPPPLYQHDRQVHSLRAFCSALARPRCYQLWMIWHMVADSHAHSRVSDAAPAKRSMHGVACGGGRWVGKDHFLIRLA